MSNYQHLHRYDHFKISTYYRILINLNSLYHLSTNRSYSIFINTTPAKSLMHVTRQVRERERDFRNCPTCWIGPSGPQASLRSHQISRSLTTACGGKQWGTGNASRSRETNEVSQRITQYGGRLREKRRDYLKAANSSLISFFRNVIWDLNFHLYNTMKHMYCKLFHYGTYIRLNAHSGVTVGHTVYHHTYSICTQNCS